jgi:hypothetical protein
VKTLTRDQVQGRKEKAERFVRDVLGEDDRADEIADESLEEYADRRKIQLADNPRGGHMTVRASNPRQKKPVVAAVSSSNGTPRATNALEIQTAAEQLSQLNELQKENERLQDQLDRIADVAAAPDDETSETEDDLKVKLNDILDLAAPGEAGDSEDDDDEEYD